MRIVSDFRDFYDGCQALGQDRTLVYVRKRQKIDLDWPVGDCGHYDLDRCGVLHGWVAIKFCGNIHRCVWLQNVNQAGSKRVHCYGIEDVDKFVRQNFPKDEDYEHYLDPPDGWAGWREKSRWPRSFSRDYFVGTFTNGLDKWSSKRYWDKTDTKFELVKEPVAVVDVVDNRKVLLVNCQLKPYNFAKVKPPQTAYMELESWLNNQARPMRPIPHVPDETLAAAKGFDKFSFRKDKAKK